MKDIILIIDPFLKEPCSNGINLISDLHADLLREDNIVSSYIEVYFPLQGRSNLRDFFFDLESKNKKVIGVFSLGSYTNVTENLEWVNILGKDLKECVIENYIPFLGICFSHQLFGWIYGAKVDFVSNRENLLEKKYNEFREIEISHPRLVSIQQGNNKFISKARHEQEVKDIPEEMELTASSHHCRIEGLAHKKYPAYSVQSHPEEFHESLEGFKLIKNFIRYFLQIRNTSNKNYH